MSVQHRPYIMQKAHQALSTREVNDILPVIDSTSIQASTEPKILVNSSNSFHMEEASLFDRPPFFSGHDYFHWKIRMTWFLKCHYDVWDVIQNGPRIPTKIENGVAIPKPEQEFDEHDKKNIQLNARAVHYLFCAISENEFRRVCHCESAKDIWRLLERTREGNDEVKAAKIRALKIKYDSFFMKDDESILEMFTRFTDMINQLQFLGIFFEEWEKVMKILRSFPKKWEEDLLTIIEKLKDVDELSLEQLIGSLMAYEIRMKSRQEVEDKEEIVKVLEEILSTIRKS